MVRRALGEVCRLDGICGQMEDEIKELMDTDHAPVLAEPNPLLIAGELRRVESMSMLGRAVEFRNRGGLGRWKVGIVEDEVYIIVRDYKHLIQRIRFSDGASWDGSDYAYRTGHHTYQAGKKYIKLS